MLVISKCKYGAAVLQKKMNIVSDPEGIFNGYKHLWVSLHCYITARYKNPEGYTHEGVVRIFGRE